jgi:two-component system LytT family response regulator
MIHALIIDDEKHCCDNLLWQLGQYCPGIEVAAVCYSAAEGLERILECRPQLIFLDVEMPGMSGFQMLEKLTSHHFHIIFTTAYDQHALRAIRAGALDYLLKPVDKDELRIAVDKAIRIEQQVTINQLTALLTQTGRNPDRSFRKVAFPTLHGYELISMSDIVFCESSSNYTHVHLHGGKSMLVSKTLKEIEEILSIAPFFRTHKTWLVNLDYAVRYIKGEGGQLVVDGGTEVPVSRNRKEELLKYITHLQV